MTIRNEQLRGFYAAQGLTGKHLRKALQYDRKAIRRACREQFQHDPVPDVSLCGSFVWFDSREGWQYWNNRDQF